MSLPGSKGQAFVLKILYVSLKWTWFLIFIMELISIIIIKDKKLVSVTAL